MLFSTIKGNRLAEDEGIFMKLAGSPPPAVTRKCLLPAPGAGSHYSSNESEAVGTLVEVMLKRAEGRIPERR